MVVSNRNLLFQGSVFRGHVSFQGSVSNPISVIYHAYANLLSSPTVPTPRFPIETWVSSWWFQPIWKIFVKMGSFPQFSGRKLKKSLSCHHPGILNGIINSLLKRNQWEKKTDSHHPTRWSTFRPIRNGLSELGTFQVDLVTQGTSIPGGTTPTKTTGVFDSMDTKTNIPKEN